MASTTGRWLLLLLLGTAWASLAVASGLMASGRRLPAPVIRACGVFCGGPLLDAVQRSGIFQDSKTFVDMPLKEEPEVVLAAFANLTNPKDTQALKAFLDKYFQPEGHELLPHTPTDHQDAPASLMAIKDEGLRSWALSLNQLWVTLSRVQEIAVSVEPQRFSILPQRFPMVIPGGRFRETYYWDTYWIVRGLLASEMNQTALGVVENLLDYVRAYGFVPNGGRAYYLDRSQPPMLSEMVLAVYEVTQNATWLAEVLPVLETEYAFWMDPRGGHVVNVSLPERDTVVLNVYKSNGETPRPESYAEDLVTATQAQKLNDRKAQDVFSGLRAAAETGWDFSSRWLAAGVGGAPDLITVNASAVVPVDLNCVLYRVERNLAKLQGLVHGPGAAAERYTAAAARRLKAMDAVLFSEASGTYRDFRLDSLSSSKVASLADFAAPIWAGLYDQSRGCFKDAYAAVGALQRSGLLQAGGGSTTLLKTGQQWDAPNAWAPLQLMLVEGLDSLRFQASSAGKLADTVAETWLTSCYKAWNSTGLMYEKYDATNPGHGGGGGEYHPQVGFGWSNGVALTLLMRAKAQMLPRVERTVVV